MIALKDDWRSPIWFASSPKLNCGAQVDKYLSIHDPFRIKKIKFEVNNKPAAHRDEDSMRMKSGKRLGQIQRDLSLSPTHLMWRKIVVYGL